MKPLSTHINEAFQIKDSENVKLHINCTAKSLSMMKSELKSNGVDFKVEKYKIIVDDLPKARMAIQMTRERLGLNCMGIVKINESVGNKDTGRKDENDPCWKGYEMVGTKEKDGKTVPNCVPANEATNEALKQREKSLPIDKNSQDYKDAVKLKDILSTDKDVKNIEVIKRKNWGYVVIFDYQNTTYLCDSEGDDKKLEIRYYRKDYSLHQAVEPLGLELTDGYTQLTEELPE